MSAELGSILSTTEVALGSDVIRLTEWHPPVNGGYVASAGAGIGLTGDGISYMFIFDAASDDALVFEIPLYDSVSKMEYDGTNCTIALHYFIPTGSTITAKTYVIVMTYRMTSDGDDINNSSNNDFSKTITLTGKTADELQSEDLGTLTGGSGAKILKMRLERNSTGAGADSFAGDLDFIAYTLKRA